MKKLTKILLGSILSVAMVVTGGLAFLNKNDAYAKSSLLYGDYGVISTSTDGATVEHGTYKQISANASFTGVKLAGPAGSTFNLGSVDIGASNWAGSATETAPSTENDKNESLVEFVFNPTVVIDKATQDKRADYIVHFIFTKGDTELDLRVHNYGHATEASAICYVAQGNGQNLMGGYRYNSKFYDQTSNINKKVLTKADAANMGLTLSSNANTTALGNSTAPNMVYYDFNDVALYSPQKYITSSELDKSLLIRDLNATDATNGDDVVWSGFTKDANGKCIVDVTVTFESMNHGNTVVITKLGNTRFDSSAPVVEIVDSDSVVDVTGGVIATNNGTAKYGTFAQSVSGKEYTGLNLTGGVGATFNLGTMSINDTYFDDNYSYVKGTGVVDLSTENNGAYTNYINTNKVTGNTRFVGSNEAVTGKSALSRSFLSFVFNPTMASDVTIIGHSVFKVTLREVDKPENFVTYNVQVSHYDKNNIEIAITCTATNNSHDRAERFYTTGITVQDAVRRLVNHNGSQAYAVSLYYDWSQQAAYTNVSGGFNSGGLYDSFRIRDFDDYSADNTDYTHPTSANLGGNTLATWEGFSKDAEVEITLEMTGLHNAGENNSIILTDLGGYDYSITGVETLPKISFLAGASVDLGSAISYKTNTISLACPEDFLNTLTYKVNGEESERIAKLNNGDIITIHSANGAQIGDEITAVVDVLSTNVIVNNGSYEVYRNDKLVTDGIQLNDVIKFIPGKHKTSELFLGDIRIASIGDNTYQYNATTGLNDAPFAKYGSDEEIYYTYTVSESDVSNGTELNVTVTFDRYCKITFTDTAKPEGEQDVVKYDWAVVGNVEFPLKTAKNGNTIYRGSSTDENTILVGWARLDAAHKNENGVFEVDREDYKVPDYNTINNQTLVNYDSRNLGAGDTGKNVLAIVPNMRYETVYVKLWVDYEIKLHSGKTEDYSGLRIVVKFDKNDIDNYVKYCASEDAITKHNPFGVMHNYITTQSELDGAKGSSVDIKTLNATHFYSDASGWNSANVANGAGLVNGTGKDSAFMQGKYGYVYCRIEAGADIWNTTIKSDEYYAYSITVNGFNEANIDKEYVFIPFINLVETNGSTTAFVMNATKVTPKVLAEQKLNEVLKTSAEETDLDLVIMEGETKYYSNYTLEDIQWLVKMAGSDRVFTAGENGEQQA